MQQYEGMADIIEMPIETTATRLWEEDYGVHLELKSNLLIREKEGLAKSLLARIRIHVPTLLESYKKQNHPDEILGFARIPKIENFD